MPDEVTLSVVVSTRDRPSEVIAKIAALQRQVAAIKGELIVISGADSPCQDVRPGVRVHQISDGSVFDCRAAAFSVARGTIIALTEDHCVHPQDWCARILDDFAHRPDLVMLGGAVANGSNERIADRMNYWMTFATYAPGQVTARRPCISQCIVRARAVAPPLRAGELETKLIEKWVAVPGAAYIDPDLLVRHDQSHGFWNTFRIHFHNGRATGGFSRQPADRLMQPRPALKRAWRDAYGHLRSTHQAFVAGHHSLSSRTWLMLLVLPLMLSHAAGAFIGYRYGPGQSPKRLV